MNYPEASSQNDLDILLMQGQVAQNAITLPIVLILSEMLISSEVLLNHIILMLLKIMPEVFLIPITEKNTNRFINDIRRAIEVEIEGIMNIWN